MSRAPGLSGISGCHTRHTEPVMLLKSLLQLVENRQPESLAALVKCEL